MIRSALRFAALMCWIPACSSSPSHGSDGGQGGGSSGGNGGVSAGGALIGFGGAGTNPTAGIGGGGACHDAGCIVGCGNGKVEPTLGETCDDGNSRSADGCSSDCTAVETNYACPTPG